MPQPIKYVRGYDFTSFQAVYPNQPLPAPKVDSELDRAGVSINQAINRLMLVQRDDGKLRNQLVNLDALSNDVRALFGSSMDPRGVWEEATEYKKLDLVSFSGVTYLAVDDHTSSPNFADDLDDGHWILFSNAVAAAGSSFFQAISGNGIDDTFSLANDLGVDSNAVMGFYNDGTGWAPINPSNFTLDGLEIEFDFIPVFGTENIFLFAPSLLLGAASAAAADAQSFAQSAGIYAGQAQASKDSILNNPGFIAVSGDLLGANTIGIVAGISSDVAAISAIASAVSNVSNYIPQIVTVNDDILSVVAVANDIAYVNLAAANMAAIIDAPNQAQAAIDARNLAEDWATKTSSPVSGGLYGAKYYAEAAAGAAPQSNWTASRDPLATDDINAGYSVGSYWVRSSISPMEAWICVSSSAGAAVWIKTTLTIDELQSLLDLKQDIAPRIQTAASGNLTPTANDDLCIRTALAAGCTIVNPTGTMADGQSIIIRLRDNGTARAITWQSAYVALGFTLPTTTVVGTTLYVFMIWNAALSRFDVTGVARGA